MPFLRLERIYETLRLYSGVQKECEIGAIYVNFDQQNSEAENWS